MKVQKLIITSFTLLVLVVVGYAGIANYQLYKAEQDALIMKDILSNTRCNINSFSKHSQDECFFHSLKHYFFIHAPNGLALLKYMCDMNHSRSCALRTYISKLGLPTESAVDIQKYVNLCRSKDVNSSTIHMCELLLQYGKRLEIKGLETIASLNLFRMEASPVNDINPYLGNDFLIKQFSKICGSQSSSICSNLEEIVEKRNALLSSFSFADCSKILPKEYCVDFVFDQQSINAEKVFKSKEYADFVDDYPFLTSPFNHPALYAKGDRFLEAIKVMAVDYSVNNEDVENTLKGIDCKSIRGLGCTAKKLNRLRSTFVYEDYFKSTGNKGLSLGYMMRSFPEVFVGAIKSNRLIEERKLANRIAIFIILLYVVFLVYLRMSKFKKGYKSMMDKERGKRESEMDSFLNKGTSENNHLRVIKDEGSDN